MRVFTIFLSCLFLTTPASAAATSVKDIPAEAEKIENYLNGLESAQARFVQTTHDGTQLVGTFYLQRPGKLRFEYDPPIEDFVVADGFFIYFYDSQLEEQTNAPIGQTLADFLLRSNIKLEDDISVEDIRRGDDILQVELVQSADPEAGSLMLGFSENPMTLKKWRVVDAQGLITEVELFHMKTDIVHPSDLFGYSDPKAEENRSFNE